MVAPLAHISLAALDHNLQQVRQLAPGCRVMAVVKANAYGHGLHLIGRHLAEKVDFLAVGRVQEGCSLRAHVKSPIVVMQGCQDQAELEACRTHQLQPVLHTKAQLQAFHDSRLDCWLKFDTGMHRLGLPLAELQNLLQRQGRLRIVGLFTHLACADEPDHPLNSIQLSGFQQLAEEAEGQGLLASAANSAAILGLPAFAGDCIRPGILLYGASPVKQQQIDLQPVMRLTAPILATAELSAGDSAGYGAAWTAKGKTRIATLAAGYADGYPREVSDAARVLVHGRLCPLAGRVSMDLMAVDISAVPEAKTGDEVILWGHEKLPVEQVAEWAGTLAYTLLTRVSPRVKRVLAEGG